MDLSLISVQGFSEELARRLVSDAPPPLTTPTQEPKQHPTGGAGILAVPPQQQKGADGTQSEQQTQKANGELGSSSVQSVFIVSTPPGVFVPRLHRRPTLHACL